MANSTTGGKKVASNNGRLTFNQNGDALVLFNGTVFRMIIGVLPDGTIGIAVSKEGEDIYDAFS